MKVLILFLLIFLSNCDNNVEEDIKLEGYSLFAKEIDIKRTDKFSSIEAKATFRGAIQVSN